MGTGASPSPSRQPPEKSPRSAPSRKHSQPAHAYYPLMNNPAYNSQYGQHPYPPPGSPPVPVYAYPSPFVAHPYPYPQQYPQPGVYPHQARPSTSATPEGPQPHPASPDTPSSANFNTNASGQSTASNSKRKRRSESGAGRASDDENDAVLAADVKKRTKTARACDGCRSRKIRCDIISDSDPQLCKHCKQYGFECTFFLPITETRFKKKKTEDESEKTPTTPHAETSRPDVTIQGPTSTAHMLHSQASVSSRMYEGYDARYHHSYEVSTNGDGLVRVANPEEQQLTLPKSLEPQVEREIVEQLINVYFTEVAPMFPVITREEFLNFPNKKPPPILIYSMCLVAAARREIPFDTFDSIRYAVNTILKAEDVLSTAQLVNVQTLLILCMTGDCHSQFVPNALSSLWVRLGSAIRMAQDLGLHRAESVKTDIETRRRVWAACVIADRWTSVTYGHPYMIDVHDCDARMPASEPYVAELLRLSLIIGRVHKTIYSPSGLALATDDSLKKILNDLSDWQMRLPEGLRYQGPESSRRAGLLHLFFACTNMLFWRVFMKISYSGPEHIKFCLTVEKWSELDTLTREAIDWLDTDERVYDVWMVVSYCAVSCALVQYHTFVRRKDDHSIQTLKKLRDLVRRWESNISSEHMSARRKSAEIITLLYETTQGPPLPLEMPPLNPTTGVKNKEPPGHLEYKEDSSRPGAGVFVAHGRGDFSGIAPGTIVSASAEQQKPDNDSNTSAPNKKGRQNVFPMDSSAFAPPLPGDPTATGQSVGTSSQTAGDNGVGLLNLNPAMNVNVQSSSVQILNALEGHQSSLDHLATVDNNYLQGLPSDLWDFPQWDEYFARFQSSEAGPSKESSHPSLT